MGRNVADTVQQLRATAGMHMTDPLSYPLPHDLFGTLPSIDLSELRIGCTEDFGVCEVDNNIRQVFRNKIAAISDYVAVCEPVEPAMDEAHRYFDVIRAESVVAGFEAAYRRDPNSLGPPRASATSWVHTAALGRAAADDAGQHSNPGHRTPSQPAAELRPRCDGLDHVLRLRPGHPSSMQ